LFCGSSDYMSDFWVFGYGSLMWNPGFDTLRRERATMFGVHRALCIHSWVYRGTRERPGLVLGLDRGGSCHGIALQARAHARAEIIAYLRERELVTRVYIEKWRRARLDDGETVTALTYVVDSGHEQYAGRLPDEEVCRIVQHGVGNSGANVDYVRNTVLHLRAMAVHDPHLEAIDRHLQIG
jgi:glutathione-specific gamma-glutamylcyclotransferase